MIFKVASNTNHSTILWKQTKGQARQHLWHKQYYMATEYKEKSIEVAMAQDYKQHWWEKNESMQMFADVPLVQQQVF